MNKKGIFLIVGIVIIVILVAVGTQLWNARHFFERCDSFAGGASDGWNYAVDGYSSVHIVTFNDANKNQVLDTSETRLPYVTGESDGMFLVTNKDGEYTTYEFKPGCCNGCWQGSSFTVSIPLGFKPTTPLHYDLSSNDATFYIGFVQEDLVKYPANMEKYPWLAGFVNNGLVISSFEYESCCTLILSIDPKETQKDIDLTDDDEMRNFVNHYLFKIIPSLNEHQVIVNQIEVTLLSTGETFFCGYSTNHTWKTITAGSYTSNKYCQEPKY